MNKQTHDQMLIEQAKKIEKRYNETVLLKRGNTLTPKQTELYTIIKENPDITIKLMMLLMGVIRSSIKEHMEVLIMKGFVTSKQVGRIKYFRVDKRKKL